MKQFDYVITDECGIHARPAGMLVKQAKPFVSTITIQKDEQSADMKKLFSLMGLGVKKGDRIVVTIDGSDEKEAAESMEHFFRDNL